jgi:HD-GYP domain-containing protein (c-di-GMP phosphodiesterase class II)
MAELERCAGTQFDPDVVAAFATLMDEQEALRNIG